MTTVTKIPSKGLSQEELLAKMDEYGANDLNWRSGKTFGYVYDAGREAEEIAIKAASKFLCDNALDPTSFPSLLKFENDLVAMTASHLNGDENTVGNFTSGGTESCMLAVKTARDWARVNKRHIKNPQMILPVTAHAAFHKAGAYFGVEVVPAPMDDSFRADAQAVRELVNENTVLIVGSAPSYAHGVVDPIGELGQIALEHEVLLHVDGCIGAFLLPYFERLGAEIPPFDFRVPGVTSISMDLHKYAYCPKGASIIVYKDRDIRKYQMYACARWTGYSIVNATMQGTKSGGPLAAAWAVVNFLGEDGYLDLARRVRDTTKRIVDGINDIPGLCVMGEPEMSLVAFTSDAVDVFHVVDEMKNRGWYIQPQFEFENSKKNIHLTIAPANDAHVEALLGDLKDSVEAAKDLKLDPVVMSVLEGLHGMSAGDLNPEAMAQMLSVAGADGGQLPDRLADINTVLNALPPGVCEPLLIEFFNQLYS